MNCKVGYVFQYYLQNFKYDENDQNKIKLLPCGTLKRMGLKKGFVVR